MVYNILGCVIGVIAFINSGIIFYTKKEKLWISILNLICALGFIGTGIAGFFIPEKYSIIPIILLLVLAVVYLCLNMAGLKKGKTSQAGKTNSGQK